jgi:hypothetical protein
VMKFGADGSQENVNGLGMNEKMGFIDGTPLGTAARAAIFV